MAMVDNLLKMLDSGRDDAMLRFGLGSAYFNQKAYADAVTHLEQCISQDPDYSAAYKLLGKSLFKLGEAGRAREIFERGLDVAHKAGDKQSVKEITVFLKKAEQESG